MKYNFIISAYQALWDKNIKDLYIVEPYVFNVLEREKRLQQFNNIEVAPFRRKSRADIDNDGRYVDAKYHKYVSILSKRLNIIHGTTHKESFWKKALSMAFVRYITLFHDVFAKCEVYFDSTNHTANILSVDSYYIPFDFEDHRYFFQNNDYGQEQIFSLYSRLFYPGVCTEMNQNPTRFDKDISHEGLKNVGVNTIRNRNNFYYLGKRGVSKFLSSLKGDENIGSKIQNSYYLVKRAIYYLVERVSEKDIQMGIIGSYFSKDNYAKLTTRSKAKISPLDWTIQLDYEDKDISWEKREHLAEFNADFDRFDEFFFSTIPYCLPKVFVEHFKEIEDLHSHRIKRYPSLRYIVSEGWISDTFMSIFLALAQEGGIKHINNEHNGFLHPFAGSYISHVIDMSDIFVTLGWFDPQLKGLVKGASLFEFSLSMNAEKKYEILYISAPSAAKVPHYSAGWGLECENAPKHLEFVRAFLKNLTMMTIKKIMYRGYPKAFLTKPMNYDKEYILREQIQNMKGLASTDEQSKIQMRQSKLVVIDYISTSYIEALVMNIPTVFFWNTDAYYLSDQYSDFFKPLVNAKICQTDPVEAARFVESIADEPEKWWFSDETQKGKNEFLNKNVGNPEVMINYLISLLN